MVDEVSPWTDFLIINRYICDLFVPKSLKFLFNNTDRIIFPSTISDTVLLSAYYNNYSFLVKIVFCDESKSDVNLEVKTLNELNKFADVSPIFLKLYYSYNWSFEDNFIDVDRESSSDNEYILINRLARAREMYNQRISNVSSIKLLAMEICQISLKSWISTAYNSPLYIDMFMSIMFMIIHGFASVRQVNPAFTHYDLHLENIMIRYEGGFVFDPHNVKFVAFKYNNEYFYVPYFGFLPKIIDFGHGVMFDTDVNSAHSNRELMYNRIDNDIIYMLFYVKYYSDEYVNLKFSNTLLSLYREIDPAGFIRSFDPAVYRKTSENFLNYDQMMRIPSFDRYKKEPSSDIIHVFNGNAMCYNS